MPKSTCPTCSGSKGSWKSCDFCSGTGKIFTGTDSKGKAKIENCTGCQNGRVWVICDTCGGYGSV